MKITGFRIGLVSARLRVPFKTALRTVDSVEDVIVELETSTGQIGRGDPSQTTLEPWERFCSAMQEVSRKVT